MKENRLSIEELRRWCRAHFTHDQRLSQFDKEVATRAMLRSMKWERQDFHPWIQGRRRIYKRQRRALERFIEMWESGLIEFTPYQSGHKRRMVYRDTPRPMPMRMTVDFTAAGPKLKLIARPKPIERMPGFRTSVLDKLRS